jgi:hypothetical protein
MNAKNVRLPLFLSIGSMDSFVFFEGNRRGRAPYWECIKTKSEMFESTRKKGRKERKTKDQASGSLNYIQPNFHGIDQFRFHSMQQQGKFRQELPFAVLNKRINIAENPSISSRPDRPSHQDYDLHEEGDCELIF